MPTKIPLIFIPGLFGSMSSEIIPGTGPWHFGPSRYTGKRFVSHILELGYTQNIDFFIMFYDWRKPCETCASDILMPLIMKARAITKCPYVNIICHGTGGLIARAYAQSTLYAHDINRLILIGTPNQGFATAFSFYSGGFLPSTCSCEPDFLSFNLYYYMQFIKDPYLSHMNICPKIFPSLADFIPSTSYGDLLFYVYRDIPYFMNRSDMALQPDFLDELNHTNYLIKDRGIHLTLIAGTGQRTLEHLEIIPYCKQGAWHDGKVINCTHTSDGDGCTLTRSVFSLEGIQYTLNADYGEILLQTASILSSLLE